MILTSAALTPISRYVWLITSSVPFVAGVPHARRLLEPGGLIVLSLRHGPAEGARAMHPVSADEIRRLARDNGVFVERCIADEDHLDRPDLRWTRMGVRLSEGRT